MSLWKRILFLAIASLPLLAAIAYWAVLSLSTPPLPELGEVPPFALTNQFGERFSSSALKGKIWVVDMIFTRCAGPCPRMTLQMRRLQQSISPDEPVRLVTITTDPGYDTPAVLRNYAERFQAAPADWTFLTGPKAVIYDLAIKGFKLPAADNNTGGEDNPDLFIHSTRFVLVDAAGKIRAYEDGAEPDAPDKLRRMIRQVER